MRWSSQVQPGGGCRGGSGLRRSDGAWFPGASSVVGLQHPSGDTVTAAHWRRWAAAVGPPGHPAKPANWSPLEAGSLPCGGGVWQTAPLAGIWVLHTEYSVQETTRYEYCTAGYPVPQPVTTQAPAQRTAHSASGPLPPSSSFSLSPGLSPVSSSSGTPVACLDHLLQAKLTTAPSRCSNVVRSSPSFVPAIKDIASSVLIPPTVVSREQMSSHIARS